MLKVNFLARIQNFSDTTADYITERVQKLSKFSKDFNQITIKIDQENNIDSAQPLYKLEANIKMPNAFIKVQQVGQNINNTIDEMILPLTKKIQRYSSQKERWVKHKEWKMEQIEEVVLPKFDDESIPMNYVPKIRRKIYEDDSPLNPAEAIEKMELLGHDSFLFKNIENMKYAMIYRRKSGGYGMIQPQ